MLNVVRDSGSIVLVGSFNPAIFHPSWLLQHGLIQQTEYEAVTRPALLKEQMDINGELPLVVSMDVTQFELTWLGMQVFRDRVIARGKTADSLLLVRDLMCSICRILEHTPVQQLGLNREIQFQIQKPEDWVKLGDVLAPKTHWRKYLLGQPGLTGMQILSSLPNHENDYSKGSVNTSLKAVSVPDRIVEVATNNHFLLGSGDHADLAATTIENEWEWAMSCAEKVASGIIHDSIAQ